MKSSSLKLFENRIFAALLITVISLSIVWAVSTQYPFNRITEAGNLGIRNILLSLWKADEATSSSSAVTLISIDDPTLSDASGLGRWQDFKREYYAKVIDRLKKDGALVIGLDVLFSEKAPSGDAVLAESMKNAGNVVLGFSNGGATRESKDSGASDFTYNSPIFPIDSLQNAARSTGFFNPIVNPVNTNVYSMVPSVIIGSGTYESFSFAILREYFDISYGKNTIPSKKNFRYLEGYALYDDPLVFVPYSKPLYPEVYIRFLPRNSTIPTISFKDVYFAETTGKMGDYDPKKVKDKIVIIGSSATALHDEYLTPSGLIDGMAIHANMIDTILKKKYVTQFSTQLEIALIIALSLFFSLFLLHVGSRIYQAIASIVALIITGTFYMFLFIFFSKLSTHAIELSLSVFLVTISATTYKYVWEEKGKRLLKNALSQYLAEDLVSSVLANYDGVKLGGSRRDVTLFFSDIAGFTTISEGMEPEELVRFLSIYLQQVSDVIISHRGFINKYEGDAVMAIWWAFGEEAEQAFLACEAALDQQKTITAMNPILKEKFGVEISVRMGINKGPAVVGNIGSQGKKIEFTALGDTVNTASRFEGINKLYGTSICVGESAKLLTESRFVFRKLDSLMVKGKERPVTIYELIGRVGEVEKVVVERARKFEVALDAYFAKDIAGAKEIFRVLAALGDVPSKTFLERIALLETQGIPEDWNPNYRATEK